MNALRLLLLLGLAGSPRIHASPTYEVEAPSLMYAPAAASLSSPMALPAALAEAFNRSAAAATPFSFQARPGLAEAPAVRWDDSRDKRGQAPSLEDLLGSRAIRDVFDADTGRATFQRKVRRQGWVARDARVSGYDMLEPLYGVTRRMYWRGLRVATSEVDFRYPKPESVQFLHLGFMEMTPVSGWRERLRQFQGLVKPGGYFLAAHSNHYDSVDRSPSLEMSTFPVDKHLLGRFPMADWTFLARFTRGRRPPDYPVTYWWTWFRDHYGWATDQNFLLLLRKRPVSGV